MTLLSIEQWREIIGYQPWHFWGLAGDCVPVTSACNSLVSKYPWQAADAAGRLDILDAIQAAEDRVKPYLGFSPAPAFRTETLSWPKYPDENTFRLGYAGGDNRWITVRLGEGKVINAGVETKTLIGAANVVLSDSDGDGIYDTFTASIATSVTNIDEIAVYFSATDRLDGQDASDDWLIRPVKVTISGGIVTVRGRSWLLVSPVLYEGIPTSNGLDAADAASYVHTVDIYRRYLNASGTTNETAQAVLVWESPPYPQWAYTYAWPNTGLDPAGVAYAIARVGVRDAQNGIVNVGEAVYDSTTGTWSAVPWYASTYRFRPPDRIQIRYRAGESLVNGKMDSRMATIIARLAAAELPKRICACDQANRSISQWQFDLARSSGGGDEAYAMISQQDLANPFGTRRGQVQAWKDIMGARILRGFSI